MLPCGFRAHPTKPCCAPSAAPSSPVGRNSLLLITCQHQLLPWSSKDINNYASSQAEAWVWMKSPACFETGGIWLCYQTILYLSDLRWVLCVLSAVSPVVSLEQYWAHSIEGNTTIFPQTTFTGQQTSLTLQNVEIVPLCEWTVWMVQLDTTDLRPTVREDIFKAAFLNSLLLSQTWTQTQKLLKTL